MNLSSISTPVGQAKVLGVIPARMSSTRLPGKPLLDINGKSLIQRVFEQAKKSALLSRLVIATDSQEIKQAAGLFKAEVIMTSSELETGSDRVAEAAQILKQRGESYSIIANIQGDMPFIEPNVIDRTIEALHSDQDFQIATIATPICDGAEFMRNSCVKVALGANGRALYFSRSAIPFWRNQPLDFLATEAEPYGYKHIGLYCFRSAALEQLTKLARVEVEKRESLEQLRALANGMTIKVVIIPNREIGHNIEVDTAEDLERARSCV
jgi:3-deoxy-manno-octulosonate cytidylyltransferase (CMP-KDO synthetase)